MSGANMLNASRNAGEQSGLLTRLAGRRKTFRCARRRKAEAFLELESAICVCGEVAAAVLQRNATAAIVNVARVIASCSYHFVVAAWSTKSC